MSLNFHIHVSCVINPFKCLMAATVKLDYNFFSQGKRLEDKCSNSHVLRLSTDYRKNCKIGSPESFAVYTVKFEHGVLVCNKMQKEWQTV